jgi:hypothetical protein
VWFTGHALSTHHPSREVAVGTYCTGFASSTHYSLEREETAPPLIIRVERLQSELTVQDLPPQLTAVRKGESSFTHHPGREVAVGSYCTGLASSTHYLLKREETAPPLITQVERLRLELTVQDLPPQLTTR